MDIFAMIFASVMSAAAVAATLMIGIYAGGLWGAGAFGVLMIALYRAFTAQSGPQCDPDGSNRLDTLNTDQLNAFQKALAED